MSEETKTMKQHFVPRAHLKRFEKDGKIIVHHFNENKNVNTYTSNTAKVCWATNLYDNDPYSENSVERALKEMEDECQREIDKLHLDGRPKTNSRVLKKYVSMLLNRSILSGIVSRNIARSSEIFGTDGKIVHKVLIDKSKELAMFNAFDDMICTHYESRDGNFFTADLPVVQITLRESPEMSPLAKFIGNNLMEPRIYNQKELMDYYSKAFLEQQKYTALICPLSETYCLMLHRKEYRTFAPEFQIYSKYDMTSSINRLMVKQSLGTVYCGTNREEEVRNILNSLPPFPEEKVKAMRELKSLIRTS